MKELVLLTVAGALTMLAIGALLGARFEEINLQVRERRLAEGWRRLTAQTRALEAHYDEINPQGYGPAFETQRLDVECPSMPRERAGAGAAPVNGWPVSPGAATS